MKLNAYCFLLILVATLAESWGGPRKRELPLSESCDPRISGSCFKADLVSTRVADCKRSKLWITCSPINDYTLSNVVDVPDVTGLRSACNPVSGLPIRCGSGYDTRCVCDKAYDYKKPRETLANQCRCQYWPEVDIRKNKPSYCTQYDHGGQSNIHFFGCCNNCNDQDSSCSGQTYQGGGSGGIDYCSSCGVSNAAGGGRITYRFNCVSCNQQEKCRNECNKNKLSTNVPGGCPYWIGCFRGCCTKAESNRRKRQATINGTVDVGEFCGDEICQTGENQLNCPSDCCPNVNPDVCQRSNCSNPSCCFDSRCCVYDILSDTSPTTPASPTTPSSAMSSFRYSLKLIVIVSYLFVFFALKLAIIA